MTHRAWVLTAVLSAATCLHAAPAGADGPDVRAAAATLAGATDASARRDAAEALASAAARADRETAVSALVEALADGSPDVRVAAASSLSTLQDPRALARLSRRLSLESDPTVVAALLLAVGRLGRAAEVPLVAPWLDRDDGRLRAAAAIALGDLGGEEARTRLLALLDAPGGPDDTWAVRGAVLLALARSGRREDAGRILVAYREGGGASQWFARAALARAVGALDPDPLPMLGKLVADDDARVSSAAAIAFVRSGHPDEAVRRLDDPNPIVRAACAAAVADGRLFHTSKKLLALATGDPVRAVRFSAALALSRLDDPASDALLVEALGADDPAVWSLALAECRRKTGAVLGRDPEAWRVRLAARRAEGARTGAR